MVSVSTESPLFRRVAACDGNDDGKGAGAGDSSVGDSKVGDGNVDEALKPFSPTPPTPNRGSMAFFPANPDFPKPILCLPSGEE